MARPLMGKALSLRRQYVEMTKDNGKKKKTGNKIWPYCVLCLLTQ